MFPTFHGTVESDPMRIPAPARTARDRDDAFAAALERADAPREPTPRPEEAPPRDVDDELQDAAPDAPRAPAADAREAAQAVADDEGATEELPAAALPHGARAEAGDLTETHRRGEPGRRIIAGKGADSLRTTSDAQTGEPLLAELRELTARGAQQRTPAPVATAPAAPTAAPASGEALLRGVEATGGRADRPAAAAVKPGYRTSQAATAQLLEQARDSVFKQILMRITGDGGEMRMRLEPPDLGELDLRFVVEKGNRLRLSIAAERADMADLIQRHVAELADTLAGIGLQLERADVHARGAGGDAAPAPGDDVPRGEDGDDAGLSDTIRPRLGGYIRADGLDFWV